jgi:hypothetical protein
MNNFIQRRACRQELSGGDPAHGSGEMQFVTAVTPGVENGGVEWPGRSTPLEVESNGSETPETLRS